MIIALLFLILFALLFPKALKFLLALAFIGGMVILSEAHAEEVITDSAADAAVLQMRTYADNCVSSYFKTKNGTFNAPKLYNKGTSECVYITIHNTFPGLSVTGRIMSRYLEVIGIKSKEAQNIEIASDPDSKALYALLAIDQYVTRSFRESMVKMCTHLRGKGDNFVVSCKWYQLGE